MQCLCEGCTEELTPVIRPKGLHGASAMILPTSLDDVPGLERLVFGGEQLEVQKVGVIIQEENEVEFAVGGYGGERSTKVRVNRSSMCAARGSAEGG
jgi:hypothetical protein